MKKLFFFIAFVVGLSSSAISQRIFLDNASAIEALKESPSQLGVADVAAEKASDLVVINSLKRQAASDFISLIMDFGNSQGTFNDYFSQSALQNARIKPEMVAETREYILDLISKED